MKMKKILVVDDEKNIRLTLSQALEAIGTAVQTAGDGEEALKKLEESDFSLIFLRPEVAGDGRAGSPASDSGLLAEDVGGYDNGPWDH